ncbi:MAG TPA: hypothetical protein VI731_00720 [Bacteroidia bacterium]|nr:hypothetical protein [Bacteroidia bacterium]
MKKNIFFAAAFLSFGFIGCYYDNVEELYPGAGLFIQCDTSGVISYTNDIFPILENNCAPCHFGTSPSSGVSLNTHADLAAQASTGTLVGVTHRMAGFPPMPPSYALDSCYMIQIKKWADAGAPNN